MRAVLLAAAFALPAGADSLTLDSGRVLEGRVSEESPSDLKLETFEGPRTIPKDRIAKRDPKGGAGFAKYEAEAKAGETDPAAQLKLAKLCLKQQAFARARAHLARAGTEPEAEALGKEIDKAEAAGRKARPQPVGLVVDVVTKQALEGPDLDAMTGGVKQASALLFRITQGGLYIKEMRVSVGGARPRPAARGAAADGTLCYDKDLSGPTVCSIGSPIGPDRWSPPMIAHALGHAVFGLDDDDRYVEGRMMGLAQFPCLMAYQWDQGFGPCCRPRLAVRFKKERLAEFLDRLPEEVEGPLPETKVSLVKK